jgi:hypothetical protein
MPQHRLDLIGIHVLQQAGTHCHQGIVAAHAGGERIRVRGIKDAHFRHIDAGLAGLAPDGVNQPLLGAIGRLLDQLHAHGALCHELRHRQRDKRATKTDHGRHHQQGLQIQVDTVLGQDALDAKHLKDNADQYQHSRIGGKKQ